MKQFIQKYKKTIYILIGLLLNTPTQVYAEESQLKLSGVHRIRYEHLSNQFRNNLSGNDEALALRTLLKAEWQKSNFSFTTELQDSRLYNRL